MIPRFRPVVGVSEWVAAVFPGRRSVERFEAEFAATFSKQDAVAFPYGRSALWAFFEAFGIKGAEVVLPAYTCSVVAYAVTLSGNQARFADISLDTFNMNLETLPSLINDRTRAVIATHTFGIPQDVFRIREIVRAAEERYGHKIWLIQDCCHAFGAEWDGVPVHSIGDAALFSFNVSKTMTSIFGGMLAFPNKADGSRLRAWRDRNFERAGMEKGIIRRAYFFLAILAFSRPLYRLTWWLQHRTPLLNGLTEAYHLDSRLEFPPDFRQRMHPSEAAVGRVQLRRYPELVAMRREAARRYRHSLGSVEGWVFPEQPAGSTYSHFPVRVPDRDSLVRSLADEGVEIGELIQYSIPNLTPYRDSEDSDDSAALASRSVINLPVSLRPPEVARVIDAVIRKTRGGRGVRAQADEPGSPRR